MCYKENLSTISAIEKVKLNGTYCNGTKSISDMKNESWVIDDIKITTKEDKYSFIYIFAKKDLNNKIYTVNTVAPEPTKLSEKEKALQGEKTYKNKCSSCHGIDAKAKPMNSDKLTDIYENQYYQKMNEYSLGRYNTITARQMNEVANFLNNDEIENIYLYIQSIK